jgi:hypothetical protein
MPACDHHTSTIKAASSMTATTASHMHTDALFHFGRTETTQPYHPLCSRTWLGPPGAKRYTHADQTLAEEHSQRSLSCPSLVNWVGPQLSLRDQPRGRVLQWCIDTTAFFFFFVDLPSHPFPLSLSLPFSSPTIIPQSAITSCPRHRTPIA